MRPDVSAETAAQAAPESVPQPGIRATVTEVRNVNDINDDYDVDVNDDDYDDDVNDIIIIIQREDPRVSRVRSIIPTQGTVTCYVSRNDL